MTLRLEAVSVSINRVPVLRALAFELRAGRLAALVGRNGAGKTSTLRSIMGLLALEAGSITLAQDRLSALPGHARARLGVGYMPEDRRLVAALSVEENILVPYWAIGARDAAARLSAIYDLLPEVKAFAARRASQLSGGQQKMVALGRAMTTGQRLLLLDEPFEGLSPAMVGRLTEAIRALRAEGRCVLIAESEAKRVSFADEVYAIERGRIVA